MNILLRSIPHDQQRYETCGDWIATRGQLREVRVSEMSHRDYIFLVMVHELIEGYLCVKRGIKPRDVDLFDMAFESRRKEGNTDEPGDHLDAPYFREHQFSTKIEKLLARELGVSWKDYD